MIAEDTFKVAAIESLKGGNILVDGIILDVNLANAECHLVTWNKHCFEFIP